MLNTRDLEQRWLKYKIKFYIPHFIIFISIIVILVIILTFINPDKKDSKVLSQNQTFIETQADKTVAIETPKTELVKESVVLKRKDYREVSTVSPKTQEKKPSQIEDNSLKLAPSLDFMKSMQHSTLPYYNEEPTIAYDKASVIVEEIQELEPVEEIQAEELVVKDEVKQISIKRRDSSNDIRDIIKRFKKKQQSCT